MFCNSRSRAAFLHTSVSRSAKLKHTSWLCGGVALGCWWFSSDIRVVSLCNDDGRQERADPSTSIPTDKLACHHNTRTSHSGKSSEAVVLVACGSFNPPTAAHVRVLEVVREEYMKRGVDVYGAYMSPVHDGYGKESLIEGRHRLAMCELAAKDSEFIMVDSWEVEREDGYTRTLYVLESIDQRLKPIFAHDGVVVPRTVLVCGGDVLESMAVPGVWDQSLLEELLSKHGVACVVRPGVDVGRVFEKRGTLVHEYRDHVMLVENEDELSKDVSSTVVREEVRKGKGGVSVESMLPNSKVMEYIRQHRLYINE